MSGCSALPHTRDAVLIERFYAHQSEFEKLLTMLNEDPKLVVLTNDRAFLDDGAEQLPAKRLAEYRRLLNIVRLEGGITRDYQGVHMTASKRGIVIPNSAKSYSYVLKEPSPLVDSLDEIITKNQGDQKPVWRRISGNWYLSYESW